MRDPIAGGHGDSSAREWRENWTLVLSALIGCSVPCVHIYSMGLLMAPLNQEFGWTRGQISASLLLASVIGVVLAPIVGLLIDRWGSRRVGLPGVAIYTGSCALLALTGPSIWTYWAVFCLVAVGISFTTVTIWSAAVASQFTKGRGLALGVTFCGSSLGSFITPILSEYVLSNYGWRATYWGISLGTFLYAMPILLLFFHDRRHGRPRDGQQRAPARPVAGVSRKEGLRSVRFWSIALVSLSASSVIMGLVVHFVPFVIAGGLDRTSAAFAAGLIGIASMTGRLIEGVLLDRFRATTVGALSLLMPTIACMAMLTYGGSLIEAMVIAAILGASLGAEVNIMAYLTSRYFGLRSYGVLFGIVYSLIALGSGIGPLLAGLIYDWNGNYLYMMWISLPVIVLCSLRILTLGAFPDFEDKAHGKAG